MNRRGRGRGGRFNNRYVPRSGPQDPPSGPPPILGPAPTFNAPLIVGYMSVDGHRRYRSDLSELRFVSKVPSGPVRLDLNHNLHTGLEPARVAATLLDGNIYLCSLQSEEEANQRKTWTEREMTMCAWGYKFEQYMTSDLPNKPPDISQPLVENAEFSLYYSTTFGSHRLLYGAQIDGLIATERTLPPPTAGFEECLQYLRQQSYVELKTNRIISNRHHEYNFKRRKLLYCWGQCFTANLKGLAVGFRDDAGVVNHVTCYDTNHIVNYCQEEWTPAGALSFLDHFLTRVKDHFRSVLQRGEGGARGAGTAGPINALFYVNTDRERTISVSEYESILPQWYIDGRRKQTNAN